MESLCCSQIRGYKDRPNLPDEPKFIAFLEAYPEISQSSDSDNARYNFIIQLVHDKVSKADVIILPSLPPRVITLTLQQGTKDQASVSKRFFACQDIITNTAQLPPPPQRVEAKEPAARPAPAPAPVPVPVPPYRPRIATTTQEPRKVSSPWGSGWTQRSAGPSSSTSWGSSNNSGNNSNPRRTNSSGPPSWVSPDVADSKSSWRNSARRPSATSTTPSTSPISPRSPVGGSRGPPSYFGPSRSASDGRKGVFGSVKAPSSVAASQSERDTSAWESASNATDTTWTNRFAMLDGESVDDGGVSDTSEGMDSERLREIAGLVVSQDDDDYPSLVAGPIQGTSGRWQKTSPIRFLEIREADVKRSGMRRNHHHKMFRCVPHNAVWTLHVYVPLEEEDAV